MDLTHGVRAAVKPFGTQTALAKALDIERSAVSQWKQVPAKWVLTIEQLTGVSRHDLRPDVFGPAPKAKKRARAT